MLFCVPIKNTNAQDAPVIKAAELDSIKNLKEFAYANDPAYWSSPEKEADDVKEEGWLEQFMGSSFFRFLLYAIVAILLIYALYRLLSEQNMLLFSKKSIRKKRQGIQEEDKHEPGLEELLKKAEKEHDFREAVRLQYLSLLFLLRDKSLVEYHPEWTNSAYLRMLRKHPSFAAFRNLTRIYDFVYYGGFETDAAKYQQIQQEFSIFRKSV
ncbi:DUF4129 domain-containing protein [Flavihumibacter sp. UBA7668]|uniref:DUF4129 domain-containing protein n=1 Tax=Flavihumibacter sp. UBA7668 TaxID=1946542 RepID=UPI0025BA8525|nr:DUF4129 domain-containing protein [Flavihumibacter sp. UBA7668]